MTSIIRFLIENYESIEKMVLEPTTGLVLVGKNGSGKTTILRAISCILNPPRESDYFPERLDPSHAVHLEMTLSLSTEDGQAILNWTKWYGYDLIDPPTHLNIVVRYECVDYQTNFFSCWYNDHHSFTVTKNQKLLFQFGGPVSVDQLDQKGEPQVHYQ
jgi:AAA15 family ATPase/GTPase